MLTVDNVFRLDALVVPDSLRLLVRNLCGARLQFEPSGYPRPVLVQGDDLAGIDLRPGHHEITFTLGDPGGPTVQADVTLATLRARALGRVHITAQAFVRRTDAGAA